MTSALVLIDVQKGVFASVYKREEVLSNIQRLIESAERNSVPIIWILHSDPELLPHYSESWQPIMAPLGYLIEKEYADAFEDTALDNLLTSLGVDTMIVAGGQTDACVRATIHGGFARGYDVTLVEDAHTTEDRSVYMNEVPTPKEVIAHTNMYWRYQTAKDRVGKVRTTSYLVDKKLQ